MLFSKETKSVSKQSLYVIGAILMCITMKISGALFFASLLGMAISLIAERYFSRFKSSKNYFENKIRSYLILMIFPMFIVYVLLTSVFIEPFLPKNTTEVANKYISTVSLHSTVDITADETLARDMIYFSNKILQATNCNESKLVCLTSQKNYKRIKQDVRSWEVISRKMGDKLSLLSLSSSPGFTSFQKAPDLEFQRNLGYGMLAFMFFYFMTLVLSYKPSKNKIKGV